MPKEKPRKGSKQSKLLKPGMLTLAVVFLWSAKHQPPQLDITSVGIWALGAIMVAMLVRAALALAAPVLGILGAILSQAVHTMQNGAEP
jgi:hypothetical protein